MLKHRLVFVLLLAAFLGCGDSPVEPSSVSIDGTWSGSSSTVSVSFVINEAGGTLTGTGNFEGPAGTLATQASGMRTGAHVTMTFTPQGFAPIYYNGTIASATAITGRLNGSGFMNMAVNLTKQ